MRGRGKGNLQCVYEQNEGYVQEGGVLIVLDFIKPMEVIFSFKGDAPLFGRGGLELSRTMKASGSTTASGKHASIRGEKTHHSTRWTIAYSLPKRTVTCTIEGPEWS